MKTLKMEKLIKFEITKDMLKDEAELTMNLIDLQSTLNPDDDIEYCFHSDTIGLKAGQFMKLIESELRPNCRKLIYRDPNGKRVLFGLNGLPKFKRLKAA